MTYIFTGSRFPQQHEIERRYIHWFQEPSMCDPMTNTYKMKLNTSRKCSQTSMAIQIG